MHLESILDIVTRIGGGGISLEERREDLDQQDLEARWLWNEELRKAILKLKTEEVIGLEPKAEAHAGGLSEDS